MSVRSFQQIIEDAAATAAVTRTNTAFMGLEETSPQEQIAALRLELRAALARVSSVQTDLEHTQGLLHSKNQRVIALEAIIRSNKAL